MDISKFHIGRPVRIKTEDDIYDSYISAITLSDENFVYFKSGNLRNTLIDKLKTNQKNVGNKFDITGGSIKGNVDVRGTVTVGANSLNAVLHKRTVGNDEYLTRMGTGQQGIEGSSKVELSKNGNVLAGLEARANGKVYNIMTEGKFLEDKDMGFIKASDYEPKGMPIYVDGVNGDDSNDGLTTSTAFKTLDHFWQEIVNRGNISPNLYLAAGQTYEWKPYNINSISLHICCFGTGEAIIQLPINESVAFYNCHLNIHGETNKKIKVIGNNGFYLDGGSCIFEYADIQTKFLSFGASVNIKNSKTNNLVLDYCGAYIHASEIGSIVGTSSSITFSECIFMTAKKSGSISRFIELSGSSITIYGTTKVDMTDPITSGTFMYLQGGSASILAAMNIQNANGNLFATGIIAKGVIILTTTARINSFSNIGATPQSISDGTVVSSEL